MYNYYIVTTFLFLFTTVTFIFLFKKVKGGIGQYNLKIYGITFIGILVTLLAISPIDPTSLAPAYGILGAIIGYLFGLKDEK